MPAKGKRRDTGAMIANELASATKPMSAYELLDRLRPSGVFAPTTVYRALDKLLSNGKVHRIESLNAFVACRSGDEHAHEHGHTELGTGFTICDRCATVSEFEIPALHECLETAAAQGMFRPRASVVELHGLCAACVDRASAENGN